MTSTNKQQKTSENKQNRNWRHRKQNRPWRLKKLSSAASMIHFSLVASFLLITSRYHFCTHPQSYVIREPVLN